MRPRSVVAIGLALTLAGLVAPAVAQDQDGYRHGRLRYVDPGVSLQRATDAGAEEASGNEPFLPGDRVWTDAGGRAEFQFPDGSLVRLDRRSKLDYSGHEEEREERIVLRLWSGGVMVHAGSRNAARFEIETPGGTVTALEGSVVRVDVDGGEARVSVYTGEGLLDDGRNRVRLASGERTFSRWGEAAAEPERFDLYERDEFVSWDEDRESAVRAADASPYLPGELAIYSDEFARNGDWRYESSVGYVWVPQVDTGWRPYWNGHWTWTPYGWTWVPSERWGWAPFHYGRWDYASSFGWYWVPGRTWGPAWVSWAVGGGYVGWCPLGRQDRPVVAWGGYRGGRVDSLDRGRAVSRGRSGSGLLDAWNVVRNNELGRRDVAQRRVAIDRIDPASVRVADSAVLRPTRDGLTLRQGDAVPRAVSTRQTPGDFVRELGVDNKTTIPAPWTRGYGPPPAGAEGARYGAPRPTDGDQREAVGRVPAGHTSEAATSAPASQATGSATPRNGRPVPWYRPADEGQRSSGGGGAANAGGGNAGARSAGTSGSTGAQRDDSGARRRDDGAYTPRSGGGGAESRRDAGESRPRQGGASYGGSSQPSGGDSARSRGGEVRSSGGESRPSGGGEAHPSGGATPRSGGGARSSGGGSSSSGHPAPRPRKD